MNSLFVFLAAVIAIMATAIVMLLQKLKTARLLLHQNEVEKECLERSNRLLRCITDETYIVENSMNGQYLIVLTETKPQTLWETALQCGMELSSTQYGGCIVTLVFAEKKEIMETFQQLLPKTIESIPVFVVSSEEENLLHMNRTFREVKTEYESAKFKQETPRTIIGKNEDDEQEPLAVEPKEMERKLFLKLINGDYEAGIEELHAILEMDHRDYRDLPLLKSKLFCILENAAYLLAFKAGSEDVLSDKVPRAWGKFELAQTAWQLENTGVEFIRMMQQQFSPAANSTDRILTDVEVYLKNNYTDCELTISIAAEKHNILPQQLSRDFKAKFKISPSDYLQQLRLEQAKNLLRNTRNSNETIAEMSGFGSVKALYRAMQKVENTTPQKFRNNYDALNEE